MDDNLFSRKYLLAAFLLGVALGLVVGDKFSPDCKGCTYTYPDGTKTFGDCVGVAEIRDMYNGGSPDGSYGYVLFSKPNITPATTTSITATTSSSSTLPSYSSTTTSTVIGWHVYPQELREAWNLKASDSAACYQVAYNAGVRACLHTLKLPATRREL